MRNVTIFLAYSQEQDSGSSGYSNHLEFIPYDTPSATNLSPKITDGMVDPNTGRERDLQYDSEEDVVPYGVYIVDFFGIESVA